MGVGKLSWNSQQLELQTPPFSPLPFLSFPFPCNRSLSLPPLSLKQSPSVSFDQAVHRGESSAPKRKQWEKTRDRDRRSTFSVTISLLECFSHCLSSAAKPCECGFLLGLLLLGTLTLGFLDMGFNSACSQLKRRIN